ncbi:hypothetical protein PINS_up006527 [Pythium insidiosum]|nr:hypothetical protein PINS_up006527 [Pythium insidiosum]
MPFTSDDLKPFVRLVSAISGIGLLALACAGFNHLNRSSGSVEGKASFGCMCVLGVIFGALLFLGESKWELFFFFFGFMRYRVGRAIVFCVAGIMIAIIGKNMNDQCRCQSYVLLIIEGVACLGCAALQIAGVFLFGNNTTSMSSSSAGASPPPRSAPHISNNNNNAESSTYTPPSPVASTKSKKADAKTFHPVSPAETSNTHDDGSVLPTWMRS